MYRFAATALLSGVVSVNAQMNRPALSIAPKQFPALEKAANGAIKNSRIRGFESISTNVFVFHLPGVRVKFSASRVEFTALEGSAPVTSSMTFAGSQSVHPAMVGDQSWPVHYAGQDGASQTVSASSIRYPSIYPNIDLLWYFREGKLEYDWVVKPGGDPDLIRIVWSGSGTLSVETRNSLRHTLAGLGVVEQLVSYQTEQRRRRTIGSAFKVTNGEVRFRVGPFDHARDLIIDPTIQFSSYLGGSNGDQILDIQFDSQGFPYILGITNSATLPFPSPTRTPLGGWDVFLAKLNPTTLQPLFVTYYGGSGNDFGYSLRISTAGLIWITGNTNSHDLPPSPVPADRSTFQGGSSDAFVAEFSATGQLIYTTYLGGSANEAAYAIDLDDQGAAYVTGFTESSNFRLQNPLMGDRPGEDVFVAKFNANGTLAYSTYLGASQGDFSWGISVLPDYTAVVTGYTSSSDFPSSNRGLSGIGDIFVARLSPTGNSLVFSGLFGGTGDDQAYGASLGADGYLYVTGYTTSSDFPVTANGFQRSPGGGVDSFLLKIDLSNYGIVYGSYLAGSGYDEGRAVTATAAGVASVGGRTHSSNFPSLNPQQAQLLGPSDGFVTVVNTVSGDLLHSTYIGTNETSGNESVFSLKTDIAGRLWAVGWTGGPGLLTTANAWQTTYGGNVDGFLLGYAEPFGINVTVNPATVARYGGQTQQFTALVTGTANSAVTWNVTGGGTISASGLYTAPLTVPVLTTATVRTRSVADTTKSATATVTLYPPATVTVTPAAVPLYGGQTRQFTATVTNAANTAVTWTLTGSGTISASGLYTAPPTVPVLTTPTVRATSVADVTKFAAATVTLYPPPTVTVTPAGAFLFGGQTRQFTAIVTNAVNTAVAWTVSGGGTIDAAGLYTAPATVGPTVVAFVTATALADLTKTATATVTLRNPGIYWKPIEMLLRGP